MIAPPTTPQLEQDKKSIDDSFEKAFSLLDQLAKDTETLKAAEEARTERLDLALTEVENVISDLKNASKRREDESRRITDEVRGLKDLIPRAMEGQNESTDNRLRELTTELKSLKTLMGQRMNSTSSTTSSFGQPPSRGTVPTSTGSAGNVSGTTNGDSVVPKPASVSTPGGNETVASIQARSSSPFGTGAPSNRAAIPSWQLASHKSTGSVNATGGENVSSEVGGP
jgi:peroxin-14